MRQRLITFYIGKQSYALPLLMVGEFCPSHEVTAVAGVDERVKGVTHLRGTSTVVLDMHRILRVESQHEKQVSDSLLILAQDSLCEEAKKLGLSTYEEPVILQVDSLGEIVDLSKDAMHPTPAHLIEPFYEGIFDADGRDLISLDFKELIAFLEKDFQEAW